MAQNRDTPIEEHHNVSNRRRIGDVRPLSTKIQEWLAEPFNFLFVSVPALALTITFPALLPLSLLALIGVHFFVMALKNVLPYRYPVYDGKDAEGKPADGILLLGQTRSKSPAERFKQCFLSNDDLRKHWLIIGATGSGKSETLKGIFFNALCWGAGFFMADGKADNKLPTDGYAMIRAFGRDNSILYLNFLLSGKTPQEVAKSRRRRTNGLNPFYDAEADTIKQMGANLLPKAEGEGKQWQEKALAVFRAVIDAVCYKRDTQGMVISVGVLIDYLALPKIEELYLEGWDSAKESGGAWPPGFMGVKNYLEVGLPGYSVEKLLRKHSRIDAPASAFGQTRGRPGQSQQSNEQTDAPSEQHGYRVGQLMPVLNLLGGTYGHIFGNMFSEIDMVDVALHDRILFLLIPSLEKSSQEAENLGKLTISCLRVMMGKNLGSELEGSYADLIESKATNANYPYLVALDELAYYFTEGLAVIFAQARSLGMSMLACSQDLEMLTKGDRAAETGAMLGNAVNKLFLKIDDSNKTWELANKTIGKQHVATYDTYERGVGSSYKRRDELRVQEVDMVTYKEMNALKAGQGVINTMGHSARIDTLYVGDWIASLKNQQFHVNRFLQVHPPAEEVFQDNLYCTQLKPSEQQQKTSRQARLLDLLTYRRTIGTTGNTPILQKIGQISYVIDELYPNESNLAKGILIYEALKRELLREQKDAPSEAVLPSEGNGITQATHAGALLSAQLEHNLIDALDEHGLPDPIALIRKPSAHVLGPAQVDQNNISGLTPVSPSHGTAAEQPDLPPTLPDSTQDERSALLFGYGSSEPDLADLPSEIDAGPAFDKPDEASTLDRIFANQTTLPSAAWINESLSNAHRLADQPRSADDSVVGITGEAMHSLRELEEALGSPNPAQSAHAMQKVVAAQTTPDTIGKGDISDAAIERFFHNELDI